MKIIIKIVRYLIKTSMKLRGVIIVAIIANIFNLISSFRDILDINYGLLKVFLIFSIVLMFVDLVEFIYKKKKYKNISA